MTLLPLLHPVEPRAALALPEFVMFMKRWHGHADKWVGWTGGSTQWRQAGKARQTMRPVWN